MCNPVHPSECTRTRNTCKRVCLLKNVSLAVCNELEEEDPSNPMNGINVPGESSYFPGKIITFPGKIQFFFPEKDHDLWLDVSHVSPS